MKTVLVGIGQAGGKLVSHIQEYDTEMGFESVQNVLAINTAKADLAPLTVDTHLIGQDRTKGQGVGSDNELAAEIMEESLAEVQQTTEDYITTQAESIILVAGLGGGTGSGGTPVLAQRLSEIYDIPVYALGILPSSKENNLAQVNAGRSLKTLTNTADATLLVDNDAWKTTGESLREGYEAINRQIAKRIGLLLAAGETSSGVAESVVDSSEVINTLRPGGIAAIGYNQSPAADTAKDNINTIMSTTRSAVLSGLSLTGETTAEAALLVVAGEPATISRKGVEKSRRWVEDETESMQVRGGDFPRETDEIGALVLLGGLQQSERVQQFYERANQAAKEATSADASEKLFQNDDLDPVY